MMVILAMERRVEGQRCSGVDYLKADYLKAGPPLQ